ncbi:hypothetical protein [Falsiruegeria mediterranea]|uniref:Uncharacterized protein n=1 Tax=Falsiruegeria mediterranea M17 TaxID=1200281 RepID=A0A2R8C8S2_9RHOB|nr:hypothetical protein [Falsiruegeria mediterranea]SPJ28829.1 hypothetical protein TRM7615_02337 [Falsiruegeria mediterranea M17]
MSDNTDPNNNPPNQQPTTAAAQQSITEPNPASASPTPQNGQNPGAPPSKWRKRLSDLSTVIRDFGIVAALISTPIIAFLFVIWDSVLRPRLTLEIMEELQKNEETYRKWHHTNVVNVLAGYKESIANVWLQTNETTIIEQLSTPNPNDFKALFKDDAFKKYFQEQVLLSVSDYSDEYVKELYDRYEHEPNMLKAWLAPVTDQVDAVYTLDLFYQKEPLKDDENRPILDDTGNPTFDRSFQISDQFYATNDQRFHINVRPETHGGFNEKFGQEAAVLAISIGTFSQNINVNGYQDDVTCIVRTALNNAPSGFVTVRADVKSLGPRDFNEPNTMDAQIPDGGFGMKIIMTAKKGRKKC